MISNARLLCSAAWDAAGKLFRIQVNPDARPRRQPNTDALPLSLLVAKSTQSKPSFTEKASWIKLHPRKHSLIIKKSSEKQDLSCFSC